MSDIMEMIKEGVYDQKEIPKFTKTCKNGHIIAKMSNFNFCPECGAEIKKYNETRKIAHNKKVDKIHKANREAMESFQKDTIEYCELSKHPKASIAFDMAWSRGHSSGLSAVVYELADLESIMD